MRAREVIARIEANGGYFVRQRGSHRRYEAVVDGQTFTTTVAMHAGDIPKGTLGQIARDMEPAFGKGWLK
jgi:predicted RNA binding protein YcfA (HicA-like mRNA interferase family)